MGDTSAFILFGPGSATDGRFGGTRDDQTRLVENPIQSGQARIERIIRSGQTVTVTTQSPHGYSTNDSILIEGALESEYNGTFCIIVITPLQFTYEIPVGTPQTPAGATIIISTYVGTCASKGVTMSPPSDYYEEDLTGVQLIMDDVNQEMNFRNSLGTTQVSRYNFNGSWFTDNLSNFNAVTWEMRSLPTWTSGTPEISFGYQQGPFIIPFTAAFTETITGPEQTVSQTVGFLTNDPSGKTNFRLDISNESDVDITNIIIDEEPV